MNIPIRFAESAHRLKGSSRTEPVTFGVPLPKGAVRSADRWTLARDGHGPCPTDVRVLESWPDGSIRWALVDALIEAGSSERAGVLQTDGLATPDAPAIGITERGPVLEVSTGPATFVFASQGRMPVQQVTVGGVPVLTGSGGGLTITGEDGTAVDIRVDRCVVEHRGRLRVVVRLDGAASIGGRRVEATTRVECFAGLSVARVLCTVRNPDAARHPGNFWDLGDPGSVLLEDVAVTFGLASAPSDPLMVSAEAGQPATAYARPFELYQDSSGGDAWQSTNHINRRRQVPVTFRGYRIGSADAAPAGLRATPIVASSGSPAGAAIAVPEFWQNFPQAIEARGDALVLRLLPRQFADRHELQGGEQKTYEWCVSFGPQVAVEDLDWCRAGTLVAVDPAWSMTSSAVDFVGPVDGGHAALIDTAIEGPDRFEAKREVVDEYGWRHFGDIYGDHEAIGHHGPAPLVSHYNNQYDPVAGFALQYVRTGDPRWWRAMSELARHVIDVDIYHTTRDKSAYNGGLFWHTYHYGDVDTATHRTYPARGKGKTFGGGPSADHNYPTGLMLYYFLSGREAAREAAIGLAEYVINLDDGRVSRFRWLSHADTGGAIATAPAFYGPARASGNSLNALVDGHRLTGDARFLRKAEQLIRRVVHPDDVIAKNQLDEPEIRWFYAMFLQALGKYLHHRAGHGLVDDEYAYGRAALLHYARWMADHEYPYLDKPEKLEFPTETWAAQDIRKSDIFYFAAMHADGEERDRFIERGRFFHRHSVETLASMPTRTLARPVIVMLTSGFMDGWFRSQAAPGEPRPVSSPSFGTPVTFVPQKAIALRRAKLLAAALAVGGLGAVLAMGLWLFG
jgi:hypothetical protein